MGSLGGTANTLMSVFALQLGALLAIGMLAITALSVSVGRDCRQVQCCERGLVLAAATFLR